MATIYVRFRNGRQLDSVAPTQLAINPNLWDDKDECVKTKAVCNEEMRTLINEEIRQLKTYIEKVYQQEKEAIDKEWLKQHLINFTILKIFSAGGSGYQAYHWRTIR